MTTSSKHSFGLHNPFHHHSSRNSSSSSRKVPEKRESADDYKRCKEEEKHLIASFETASQRTPLSPQEVAKDPAQKGVGQPAKHLAVNDFKFLKTLGTGAHK